jgi:hypothetical protein
MELSNACPPQENKLGGEWLQTGFSKKFALAGNLPDEEIFLNCLL